MVAIRHIANATINVGKRNTQGINVAYLRGYWNENESENFMSDYQFQIYEKVRVAERKLEKSNRGKADDQKTSTYRIFSRAYCNFVFPNPPGRPMPKNKMQEAKEGDEKFDLEKAKNRR